MGKKVEMKSDMMAEIRTEDGKLVSCIVEEPKVISYAFSWEEVKEKGWEARKWEVAVAAMRGLLAHKETLTGWPVEDIADYSFRLADALVDAFKKEEKNGKVK